MSPAPSRVEWLQDELVKLNRRALPRDQFFAELAPRLRRVFDSDALCWHTLDPTTLLLTSAAPVELVGAGVYTLESVQAAGERMIAQEYMGDGINTFAQLARRRVPVGILGELTRGRPERSERYRELLAPAGIPFEMRAAFVSRRRAWGAVHVARQAGRRDFTPADAAALARVAGAIADGIRTSLRFDAARRAAGAGAPGLVVLDAHDEVELITPPARELMAALRWHGSVGGEDVPAVGVLALAAHVRGAARARAAQSGAVAVPSPIGWITLHGSLPDGDADGRVAVVLEHVASDTATALRLETHGVTEREREVAVLLARGLSNSEIATALVLSPYTVQDHIKSLFDKTGVSTRQGLVARVFIDDYMPQVVRGGDLRANGSFAGTSLAGVATMNTTTSAGGPR